MKKNTLFFVLCLILLSSCVSPNYLVNKTIWVNISPAEKDGVKGNVITSLYFVSNNTVDIYSSVMVDTSIAVKPFKWAKGTYSVSCNSKKANNLSIAAITLKKDTVKYNSIYQKDDTMILVSDSIANVFHKLHDVKLP
ncbi:MAG: hypothetical protein LBP85_05250 [Prevotellaceae bacterium]|jgi:hypothetical protein|nr:hypothetical protein [Prevotellaceae bacterium]